MGTLQTLLNKRGRRVLLLGDQGSGKTGMIGMLAQWFDVFILDTDSNLLSLDRFVPEEYKHRLHIEPIMDSTALDEKSGLLRPVNEPKAWARIIKLLKYEWVDGETGERFGNPSTWGPDRVLVIDSCSNLEDPAFLYSLALNNNPEFDKFSRKRQIADIGDAQNLQKALIANLTHSNLNCSIIFSTHTKHLKVQERPDDDEVVLAAQERRRKKLAGASGVQKAEAAANSAPVGPAAMAAAARVTREREKAERAERQQQKQKIDTTYTFERYPNFIGQGVSKNVGKDFDYVVLAEKKPGAEPRLRTVSTPDITLKCPADLPEFLGPKDGLYRLLTAATTKDVKNGD